MKKILQYLFPDLFPSDIKGFRRETITNNDIKFVSNKATTTNSDINFKLKSGEIQTVTMPEIMGQNNFEVIEWLCKEGDVVKSGQIICVLENENIALEFESFTEGKIHFTCEKHIILHKGEVLFEIIGI